jgi:hypothetical protein
MEAQEEAIRPGPGEARARPWLLIAVLVLGCAVRFATVDRPFDHRSLAPWREADYLSIARAFDREGLDPLHPRVDWREDTPGYAEMELPVLPWIAALGYRLLGEHEQILRALSALASAAALLAFARLARRVVPGPGALLAIAAFAANPLLVQFAGAMQPDELMVLFTVLAMDALWRWLDEGRESLLLRACALAAAAILAKAMAAYLGFVFAYLILRKRGPGALREPRIWIGAALALAPPLAWYAWAHHFYVSTGLSLGVSNEHHAISWALIRAPLRPLVGNLKIELFSVFAIAGIPLAGCAFLLPWRRIEPAVAWYLGIALAYLLAADTSGDEWSFYYHAISAPPACLLVGLGLAGVWERAARVGEPRASRLRALGAALGVAAIALAAYRSERLAYGWRDAQPQLEAYYRCARELAPSVPRGGRIVVRGGEERDEHGHPIAWNESMAFAWMDRQGFNYPKEEFGVAALDAIAARGGRYWLAQPPDLGDAAIRSEVERRYRLLARCDGYALYDLAPD